MNMRTIIWIIILPFIILFVWYTVGKYKWTSEVDWLKIKNRVLKDKVRWLETDVEVNKAYIDFLQEKVQRFEKFVPTTEKKKETILFLHDLWRTGSQIGKELWLKKSTVNAALRKRRKK